MDDADFEKLQQTVNLHAQRLDKFEDSLKENTQLTRSIYDSNKQILELQKGLVDGTKFLCRLACAFAWVIERINKLFTSVVDSAHKLVIIITGVSFLWHWFSVQITSFFKGFTAFFKLLF